MPENVPPAPEAVTLDFFNTLVFHRDGRGRGKRLMEYLQGQGLDPAPWEHRVLYDVFEHHAATYSPSASSSEKLVYYSDLAHRVFERLGIRAAPDQASAHAEPLWEILGPSCFDVFPDVPETLKALRDMGLRLGVVSNWQSGLAHFCTELGLANFFECILSSADFGAEKPDPRIFLEACSQLGSTPGRTLHVGDTFLDDFVGGEAAGLQVLLIDRAQQAEGEARVVQTFHDIVDVVAGRNGRSSRAT
jgi:HAD superfamily hydrolase (TIGR01549 family)